MRISRLPPSSIYYILDRILEEYPKEVDSWIGLRFAKSSQDFEGWLKSLEEKANGEKVRP